MNTAKTLILSLGLTAAAAFGQGRHRNVQFNGQALTAQQEARLEALERVYGTRLPDASYWYDNRSGAIGFWHGPAVAVIPAGLGFGGPMPPNCSGGGTGVFVNGRELHYLDVAALSTLGPVYRGRYWLDSNGDYGYEGGPRTGNLVAAAYQASGRNNGGGQHRVYSPGELSGVIVNSAGACTATACFYPGQ